ncbi:IS110 family transposase [Mycolicibacterium sp. 120270]|uniref:IS110 family transposase n=1 Tax=Mycolicibacterium sp. 120270 TaxID=3090600 RepID=UPI00299ED9F3|nr:IS110 family transposase [Mycolicibacterium sp. 120270]MDX1887941.1 IS110 family transposase [Mycolicibacterium sp. 120270]
MSVLDVALDPATVIVAVDPGKVFHRVWISDGSGMVTDPMSLTVSCVGIAQLELALSSHHAQAPVIAIEATGSLHRPWVTELERRHPGSVRLFAPSETKAARTQLGSGRFKTDDRDCAALTYLARQGGGRRYSQQSAVDALRAAVRHRRGLVGDRKVAQQRLHDQLNALCPGLSAPSGHGRSLAVETPTGLAVLACAAAFAGRPPQLRSLMSRAPGRLTTNTALYWLDRWRGCLPPPADAQQRAHRLTRDLDRYRRLRDDIDAIDGEVAALLADTDGQILTTLPGVAAVRAAAFAAHSLPIERFPDAEHLYSATGLAPALYQSATLSRRGRISRQGLAEHRDALMSIAWGLSQFSPSFIERDAELRARGMAPIQARVALARHACRLAYRLLRTQQPFDEQRYRRGRLSGER